MRHAYTLPMSCQWLSKVDLNPNYHIFSVLYDIVKLDLVGTPIFSHDSPDIIVVIEYVDIRMRWWKNIVLIYYLTPVFLTPRLLFLSQLPAPIFCNLYIKCWLLWLYYYF